MYTSTSNDESEVFGRSQEAGLLGNQSPRAAPHQNLSALPIFPSPTITAVRPDLHECWSVGPTVLSTKPFLLYILLDTGGAKGAKEMARTVYATSVRGSPVVLLAHLTTLSANFGTLIGLLS